MAAALQHRFLFNQRGERLFNYGLSKIDFHANSMDTGSDWVSTPYGMAIDLDGSNDEFRADTAVVGNIFTIDVLVMSRRATGWESLYVDNGGGVGFFLNSRRLEWYSGGAASASVIPQNVVTRVTCVYDGATFSWYINGRPDGTSAMASKTLPTTLTIRIGGHGGSEQLDGQIYDFSLWTRALSASEVWSHYLDPYQVFRRGIRRAYAYAAAPGGSNLLLKLQHHGAFL